MFNKALQIWTIDIVFFLQGTLQLFIDNGRRFGLSVSSSHITGLSSMYCRTKKMIDVIADDVIVEAALPDGSLRDLSFASVPRYGGLECAKDRFKGICSNVLEPR